MGRQPCCDKIGLKRGPWTIEEDQKLMTFILNNGIQCWRQVPKLAGLKRCGKSCRLRWINYLRPDLKRGALTEAEEDMIIELHARLGNRWSKIATHLPGRTDNEIKNYWNTKIKKKLKLLGLDPVTQKPIEQTRSSLLENEQVHQNNSYKEQETSNSELQESIVSDTFQSQQVEGTLESCSFVSNSSNINGVKEGQDSGHMMVQNAEPLDTLPMLLDGFQMGDPFQNWMDYPFSCDVFNHLENHFA